MFKEIIYKDEIYDPSIKWNEIDDFSDLIPGELVLLVDLKWDGFIKSTNTTKDPYLNIANDICRIGCFSGKSFIYEKNILLPKSTFKPRFWCRMQIYCNK